VKGCVAKILQRNTVLAPLKIMLGNYHKKMCTVENLLLGKYRLIYFWIIFASELKLDLKIFVKHLP
jgi:hypothetical protein